MLETSTPTSNSSSWWRRWWVIVINYHHHRRWIPIFTNFLSTHKTFLVALWLTFFFTVFYWQRDAATGRLLLFRRTFPSRPFPKLRPVVFNLTDFGAVGDGVNVNTVAFEQAIRAISRFRKKGGGQLNVPPGYWLTAPFNLTSHMTLFLAEGAVILGINVSNSWCLFVLMALSFLYGNRINLLILIVSFYMTELDLIAVLKKL